MKPVEQIKKFFFFFQNLHLKLRMRNLYTLCVHKYTPNFFTLSIYKYKPNFIKHTSTAETNEINLSLSCLSSEHDVSTSVTEKKITFLIQMYIQNYKKLYNQSVTNLIGQHFLTCSQFALTFSSQWVM